MKFGISLPNNQGVRSVRALIDLAKEAETLGYHSVWVSEHLFHSSYVAERLGDKPYHEALMILSAAAYATQTVRLGTSVLVLPWHHPVRLAKQVATIDELSGGRISLGVGVAQTPDEFANLNVAYDERGAISDEMIDAMRCLWMQEFPTFEGDYFSFSELRFEPKPLQSPLPILIGGTSKRALRRVRDKGDGWHAMSLSVEQVRESIAAIPDKTTSIRLVGEIVDKSSDRPLEQRRQLKCTLEEIRQQVVAYSAAGVEEIVIDANSLDFEASVDFYRVFYREVVALTQS
jgi:probable F420-dependent oxidoreductase